MSDDPQRGNPLETAPIPPLLLRYSVPTALTLMVNFLYNIVDQIFIGRGVGISGMYHNAPRWSKTNTTHLGGGSRRRRTPPSAKP